MITLDELLKRECIIDTSLLSNFVFTGHAELLDKLVSGPLLIPPAVLDPIEVIDSSNYVVAPACEFLKPLHEVYGGTSEVYASVAPLIQSFALGKNSLWQPVELTLEELSLASSFRTREIWKSTTNVDNRFTKRGLGAGEAEACAVALKRNLTLLIDDQPAIELMRGLGHAVSHARTCMLLQHAVENEYIPCSDAMHLFNALIVDKFGFHATRAKGTERLWFRCDPPRCVWDVA